MSDIIITSFYKFFNFENYQDYKQPFLDFLQSRNMKGTIILAPEGINIGVSGERKAMDELYEYVKTEFKFDALDEKEHTADSHPYRKCKIKTKKETITFGETLNIDNHVGTYLSPDEWDEMLTKPGVMLIDTRNSYEVEDGTFEGAIDPKTNSFTELKPWIEENLKGKEEETILMCCTGGIRCEKSTTYLKQKGFKNVYHLKGGILKYLEEKKGKESKWHGKCYVFDERNAV